jgi:hypothetical protein
LERVEIDDQELAALCAKLKEMETDYEQRPIQHREEYKEQFNDLQALHQRREKCRKIADDYENASFDLKLIIPC